MSRNITGKSIIHLVALALFWLGAGSSQAGINGRYVRLEYPPGIGMGDSGSILALCEVEVLSGGKNVARQAQAVQSPGGRGPAAQAIDGDRKSNTHSKRERNPWLDIDLGSVQQIDKIKVLPRDINPFHGGLVTILDQQRKVVWYQRYPRAPKVVEAVPAAMAGRYVGLHLPQDRIGWYDVGAEQDNERTFKMDELKLPPLADAAQRMAAFRQRDSRPAVEQLCRRLHTAVDPNAMGLERFKEHYEQGRFSEALDAYRDFFFARLAEPEKYGIPLSAFDDRRDFLRDGYQTTVDTIALDEAMRNRRVALRENSVLVCEVGPPGAARWAPPEVDRFKPQEPVPGQKAASEEMELFAVQNGLVFSMFDNLLKSYAATGNTEHLGRWMDYLDDWCLHGRQDVFNSSLNLTMSTELLTQYFARRLSLFRYIAENRPAFPGDLRSTTLARHVLASIEDVPPYVVRARRAEMANWGCMGTEDLAHLSIFFSEFHAMRSYAREAMRLAMSSYLQHRTLDGENIEAWDDGHRTADKGMMAVFDLFPQMPLATPKADAMQMRYLGDLKSTFFRNVLTHVSPEGYYRPHWLPNPEMRDTWRAMHAPAARKMLFDKFLLGDTYAPLIGSEPEVLARVAALKGEPAGPAPARLSDIAPYSTICFLRDSWAPGSEYFILRAFRERSQASAVRPVDNKNFLSGEGSMRYDLMKEGRSLLSSEGIVIDKKPSNRWHDAIPTGGKTAYCAMAGRHVSPTRFHSSARFDLAEVMRNDPYSRPVRTRPTDWYGVWERQPGIDNTPIKDITAYRQVFHVRGEGLWIVADRIENPHHKSFDYSNFWTFPALVNPEGYREQIESLRKAGHRLIEEDAQRQRIRTANPGYANLSTYFFGHAFELVQEITTKGNYLSTAKAKAQIDIIHAAGDGAPVFANSLRKSGIRWQGQGNQALVVVHQTREPIADPKRQFDGDLRDIQELSGPGGVTGFRATTRSGVFVAMQSGPEKINALEAGPGRVRGESLLVVEKDGLLSGMALGTDQTITLQGRAFKTGSADFEYALTKEGQFTATPIRRAIDTVKISPEQNVFTDTLAVSFDIPTQDDQDIEFRYTLDGSDPTLESALYRGPFVIDQDTYVKVRPFRKGLKTTPFNIPGEEAGKTVGAIFRKDTLWPATQVPVAGPGLAYEYFEGPWPMLFTHAGVRGMLEPKRRGKANGLLLSDELQTIRTTDKAYAVRYDGLIRAPENGVYAFYAPQHLYTPTMDAGYDLRVWIDGKEWFPSPTLHSENVWHVPLQAGSHRLEVLLVDYRWKTFKNEYVMSWQEGQMWQGTPVLEVSGPDLERQPIPQMWIYH